MEELQYTMVPVAELRLTADVWLSMLDEDLIRKYVADIGQYGFQYPLMIFPDGVVHGAYAPEFLAAKRMGRESVPCRTLT